MNSNKINRLFDSPLFDSEGLVVEKKENFLVMPRYYSATERMQRAITNSDKFDLKSYEADGGDAWINPKRELFFDRQKAKMPSLYDRASETAKRVGKGWQMTVWLYKKLGGTF